MNTVLQLLPLAVATLGGLVAGFWPGWTAGAWHARRDPGQLLDQEDEHDRAWDAEFGTTIMLPRRWQDIPDASGHAASACPGMSSAALAFGYPHPCAEQRPRPVPGSPGMLAMTRPHWTPGRCWCDRFHRDEPTTVALIVRPDDEASERPATIAEIAADAEYRLTWTELGAQAASAYNWYDREFETGQFRRIEP